jgi:hypothetical protein
MNRALLTVCLVWLVSLAVWLGALAQLGQPRHAASIPDRSTLIRYPGP